MSATNSHILDFITDGGGKLGYEMDSLPPFCDMNNILKNKIKASEYFKRRNND